jgi:glucose/arabinose dehydrogenase
MHSPSPFRPKHLIALGLEGLAALASVAFRHEGPAPAARTAVDITLQTLGNLGAPITSVENAGDSRLFLTIQTGRILIWDGTSFLTTPFLDISSLISCCTERGLLSAAFHPQYATNGFFFVYYTNNAGNVTIARYAVSSGNPNLANPASGVVLLTIPHPTNANHNGGQLQFGPDGFLYIGTGDGGSANDPPCNAQRDDVLLGKLLRIDVDQNVGSSPFYGIPPSNPFVGGGLPLDEIWAKGLRNPWRFSFDRMTGDLYIGDVGQDEREEIDFQPRASAGGENYGWKIMEGTRCGDGGSSGCPAGVPACNSPVFKYPIFEYDHSTGDCSVTGGYVYRGSAFPDLAGVYFYGDYCTGKIWGSGQLTTPRAAGLSSFGQDSSGELYLATTNGLFARVLGSGPIATPTPTSTRQISGRAALPKRTAGPVLRVP